MRFGLLRSRLLTASLALGATWLLALSSSATSLTGASLFWDAGTLGNGTLNLLGNAATSCTSDPVGGSCSLSSFTPLNGFYTVNSWTSSWDSEPFVTNNLNVTNNSANPLTFDVIVTAPVALTGPQTAMSGSIGITLTNTTGTAVLTDAGASVYRALIDGSVVRTLFDPTYTQTCTPPFCTITQNADFGVLPNPPETGPQANTDIAIRLRFSLSPGDSASITSVFNIDAVPEPATGALLGLGLVALAAARRLARPRAQRR